MKLKYINSLTALLMAFIVGSCGVNYIEIDADDPWAPDVPVEINGTMCDYPIWGTVTDTEGNPLQGVLVVSGDCHATSDAAGFFSIDRIDRVSERALVKFIRDGYFSVVRSCYLSQDTNYGWEVAMKSKSGGAVTSAKFNSSSAETLRASGMVISLPADAYVDAATGNEYSGTVNAAMYYLSPEADRFTELMPGGDLAAYDSAGNENVLMSYGMVNVELSDNDGNRLQIRKGAKARVEFPVVQSLSDGMPGNIPLWSFDETKGMWIEEGLASDDGNGHFVGEVSHFSWWNIDTEFEQAWIEGYVTNDLGEPLPDIEILINRQLKVKSDKNGYYKKLVLSNTRFEVKVPSESYGNCTPEYSRTVGPVPSNATLRHDITLPTLYYVYGSIIDQNEKGVSGAYKIKYPGGESKWETTDENGNFKYYLPLNCSGEASISAVTGKGSVGNMKFTIPEKENVEVILRIDSSTIIPDQPDIVANCGGGNVYYLNVKRPGAQDLGGVVIEDACMSVMTDMADEVYDVFLLEIPGYSPEKSEYTSFTLMALDGNKMVSCNNGRLRVTKENDTYYYNLAGTGMYLSLDKYGELSDMKEAEITVNNVGISHLMTLERRENYTPASPFPSFTPQLATPAPVAMLITKSEKCGTGGFLFYNGGLADFNNLCAQADKTTYRCLYKDLEYATYIKDNSAMEIVFDSYAPKINSSSWRGIPMFTLGGMFEDEDDWDEYTYESQIQVSMYNGGTIPIEYLLGDDLDDEDDAAGRTRGASLKLKKAMESYTRLKSIKDYPALLKKKAPRK